MTRLEFDNKKVTEVYAKLIEVMQEAKLSVGEILVAYGNLGIVLGSSIKGYKGKIPSLEEIEKEYLQNRGPGLAMILQGYEVCSWYEDWEELMLTEEFKEE